MRRGGASSLYGVPLTLALALQDTDADADADAEYLQIYTPILQYRPRRDLKDLESSEDRYITRTGEDASILYVINCVCRECPIIFYLGFAHRVPAE